MSILKYIPFSSSLQLTRIKLALLLSFSSLMLLQLLFGFRSFEDYLIGFVYILFLNDLYVKVRYPHYQSIQMGEGPISRSTMSLVFLILFTLPFLLDAFNVNDGVRLVIYRVGFVLWCQIFILDAFKNYKQSNSRQWLAIMSLAMMIMVVGSFI